mmetsp:Transcript_16335/g.22902  ORF Transcript_16335/g.22902 Transcript_16335/m.22902 type:complete len:90 (+) Transcript_16335:120-389(+)
MGAGPGRITICNKDKRSGYTASDAATIKIKLDGEPIDTPKWTPVTPFWIGCKQIGEFPDQVGKTPLLSFKIEMATNARFMFYIWAVIVE